MFLVELNLGPILINRLICVINIRKMTFLSEGRVPDSMCLKSSQTSFYLLPASSRNRRAVDVNGTMES